MTCTVCGKRFEALGLGGLCPSCLLAAGMGHLEEDASFLEPGPDPQAGAKPGGRGRLGEYELVEEIARGGMGIVYRARHTKLKREAALKMILAGKIASPEAIDRFLTEARAAAKLDHPNIVSVYEVGELEGDHFYSMQLIKGTNLAEKMLELKLREHQTKSRALARQKEIAALVSKIAGALEYAHGRGVLHRDIKPNNIMVDESGEPLLTDFGLAKLTGKEDNGLTLSTSILGSPSYMAPEQAKGGAKDVSIAADIYGLGAILYEFLSGEPPFKGETAMETIQRVIHDEPQSIRPLRPLVHPDLETICLKCLEKNPERRYSSARLLGDELERFIRGEPIHARPVSTAGHVWRWVCRNPVLGGLAGTAMLAVTVGAIGVTWQWHRARQANARLNESIEHLNWRHISHLLDEDKTQRAVARLAQLIRRDPHHWRAATYAMSILENQLFPMPACSPIDNPNGSVGVHPQLSPDGRWIAMVERKHGVILQEVANGKATHLFAETPVRSIAFHPLRPMLAVGAADGKIFFWDTDAHAPAGQVVQVPGGQLEEIRICGDGSRLFARASTRVHFWKVPITGEGALSAPSSVDPGHPIDGLRTSRDGSRVLVWTAKGTGDEPDLHLVATGNSQVQVISATGVGRAVISADGSRAAASFTPFAIKVWDATTPERSVVIDDIRGTISAIALTPDGKYLCASGRHGFAHRWDAVTGSPIRSEMKHQYEIRSLEMSRDGELVLTGADDHTARLWEIAQGKPFSERMFHQSLVHSASMNAAQTHVLTLSGRSRETILVWRVPSKPPVTKYSPDDARDMSAVRLSPFERYAVTASSRAGRYFLTVSSVPDGEVVFRSGPFPSDVYGAMFTPNESKLIAVRTDGSILGWSTDDWQPLWPLRRVEDGILPSIMSPDGNLIATGSPRGVVRIWRVETGEQEHEMAQGGSIRGLAFSADSNRLVSGSSNGTALVWNVASGMEICRFTGHDEMVLCVSFDATGKRVLSTSYDTTVRVWDAETGEELIPPFRHRSEAADACFSPDGTRIVTGSRDGTMCVWDAATGEQLETPRLHPESVRTVSLSPDGQRILVVDHAGPRVWDAATLEPITIHFDHPLASGLGIDTPSVRAAFTSDGRRIFMGTSSAMARFWNIPDAPAGIPAWFPRFLEVVAGLRFDASDQVEVIAPEESLEFRQRIKRMSGKEHYLLWAKAYLDR